MNKRESHTLVVRNVAKRFGGVQALDLRGSEINFHSGMITAVLGSNGAGKTTLLNVINGILTADEGEVLLDEVDISSLPAWQRGRMGVSRLWQDIRLFWDMNCIENVQVAIPQQFGENVMAAIFCWSKVASGEELTRRKAAEVLELVGLGALKEKLASEISYGQQKLLAIARLICNERIRVALLDEPFSGLDQSMIGRVKDVLEQLRGRGIIVVMIEHNMHAIRGFVDEAVFLHEGRTIPVDGIEGIIRAQTIRRRYMGME